MSFVDKFDLGSDDEKVLGLARAAESAERYEDMCLFMQQLVKLTSASGRPLSVEERNLLSVAFKNVIGARRASWRTFSGIETEVAEKQISAYKGQIQAELKMCCDMVLDLLKTNLIDSSEGESKVFYLKMSGDYYRYLAEAITEEDKKYGQLASEDYSRAVEIADTTLDPTHPVRLGLALNYSVCYYEILKEPEKACAMAKKAFDDSICKLDGLKESDYKDSTLIMQLLRDNLTLWTSQDDEDDNVKLEDFDED